MSIGLTKQQSACKAFIAGYIAKHGCSPSYEEIQAALKLGSKSGVHRLLSGLTERGHIRRLGHRARSIEILQPETAAVLDLQTVEQLRLTIAIAAGLLAHKTSNIECETVLCRIADRIAHRPKTEGRAVA